MGSYPFETQDTAFQPPVFLLIDILVSSIAQKISQHGWALASCHIQRINSKNGRSVENRIVNTQYVVNVQSIL